MLTLYHNDMSTCSQKVRFVLAHKNVPWTSVTLDLRAGDQLKPEFLRINPKGLVPVIDHDGELIPESNVIVEYLNDAYPAPPLLPPDARARARVRGWMKRLDDGIHLEVVALSFAIAFRHQLLAVKNTPALLEQHLAGIPDPYIREVQRQIVPTGVESPRFVQAIAEFEKLLRTMDAALAAQPWLVGADLTLADIAYSPYVTRLDQLRLHDLWNDKPQFAAWYDRLRDTHGYREGFVKWFNPKYLPLMAEAGDAAAPRVREVLQAVRAAR